MAKFLGVDYVGLYLLSGAAGTLGAIWASWKYGGLPNERPDLANAERAVKG